MVMKVYQLMSICGGSVSADSVELDCQMFKHIFCNAPKPISKQALESLNYLGVMSDTLCVGSESEHVGECWEKVGECGWALIGGNRAQKTSLTNLNLRRFLLQWITHQETQRRKIML